MTAPEPASNRPVPKPPATGADAWKNRPTSCWPTPPSANGSPDLPKRFRATLERLDDVASTPVTDHAEVYDGVHADLRRALDDVERPA